MNRLLKTLFRNNPFLDGLAKMNSTQMIFSDFNGRISYCNEAIQNILKITGDEIAGRNLTDILTEADSKTIKQLMVDWYLNPKQDNENLSLITKSPTMINFLDIKGMPQTLVCNIYITNEIFLIIGEVPAIQNQILESDLLDLNNQLTVLSRENIRKSRELQRALNQLQEAQAKLVQSEKMAALGQLTAGIAHEINNPLAFISNNEQLLNNDFSELLTFINTIGDNLSQLQLSATPVYEELIKCANQIDLEYLVESIPRKIAANVTGLDRVKQIVIDLRNFSRLDEAERKQVDILEGIEAAIQFVRAYAMTKNVSITTNFVEISLIECMPGPLNQAFTNILTNAIQASPSGSEVRVFTEVTSKGFIIGVEDQGGGIPQEIIGKVFDPFFTTKPVGEGTGLGLGIALHIMKSHNGEILIDSQVGNGTTFRLVLPETLVSKQR